MPASPWLARPLLVCAVLAVGSSAAGCPYHASKQETFTQSSVPLSNSADRMASSGSAHSRGLKQAPAAAPSVAGGCSLAVGGNAVTYSQCSTVDAGTAYDLYYTLTPSGASAVMAVGIAANSDGWVGIGFPQSGQEMVGTDSIIAKADASSPTGASAQAYHMAAQNSAGVQPPAQYLNVTGITASAAAGRIASMFTVTLTGAMAASANAGSLNVIYAVGPVSARGNLQTHTLNAGAVLSPQAAAVATMPANSHSTPHYHRMLAAHGWIAVIGLGFLIPLGIVISKASSHTKLWTAGFWLHVPVQVLGLLVGIVGVALGSQLDVDGELLKAHKGIGIAAVVAVAVQAVIAFSWRPPPKSAKRWIFQSYHWWLGRAAACLAIVNVFLGLHSQAPDLTHYIIAYAVVIGVLFLLWLAAALVKWRSEPVFIPSKYQPMGKGANYDGTELAPAADGHANGHSNGHANGSVTQSTEPKAAHT